VKSRHWNANITRIQKQTYLDIRVASYISGMMCDNERYDASRALNWALS
jgi:hypothetical protein